MARVDRVRIFRKIQLRQPLWIFTVFFLKERQRAIYPPDRGHGRCVRASLQGISLGVSRLFKRDEECGSGGKNHYEANYSGEGPPYWPGTPCQNPKDWHAGDRDLKSNGRDQGGGSVAREGTHQRKRRQKEQCPRPANVTYGTPKYK